MRFTRAQWSLAVLACLGAICHSAQAELVSGSGAAMGAEVHLHLGSLVREQKVVSCSGGHCQCTIVTQGPNAGRPNCGSNTLSLPGQGLTVEPTWHRRAEVSFAGQQGNDASKYINPIQYKRLFMHTSSPQCSPGFYTYAAFREAVAAFPRFANGPNHQKNRRELAAFLAQISQATKGGWPGAPDGPFAWGLCHREVGGRGQTPTDDHCVPDKRWPCAPGRAYYGRGPFQLSGNRNYGWVGEALGLDLLNTPEMVSNDSVVAFKTALFLWMAPHGGRPSPHEVMTGRVPTRKEDVAAGRRPGYGWVTNILVGAAECGKRPIPPRQASRIGFFRRVSAILGVRLGPNLNCADQRPYEDGMLERGEL